MQLPFTAPQFFALFERYNLAIGPVPPLVAVLAALALLLLASRGWPGATRAAAALLALLWTWNGVLYHGLYLSGINPAAYGFAALFVVQGVLFAACALSSRRLRLELRRDVPTVAGATLIGYALVVYPLWGLWLGHAYPRAPLFGVAPCPTTLFTLGLLLWLRSALSVRLLLLAIPVLWALVGTVAALRLGVVEDLGLPVAAVVAVLVSVRPGGAATP